MDSSTTTPRADLFPIERCLVIFLLLLCFIEIRADNANSVVPDKALKSVASDLGPDCLSVTLLD